jgi:methylenetetrahydrofolate reductase (NADPH)
VLRRLALQIVGVRLAGYAGAQITGLHAPEKVHALEAIVAQVEAECPDRTTWREAWRAAMTWSIGAIADPVPPVNRWKLGERRRARATLRERTRYHALAAVHAAIFDRGPVAGALGALLRPLDDHTDTRTSRTLARALERVESAVKRPLVGCETCGMCRLAATQYVCPETCPKGLANGPCGGTTENRCEFGDRECIHSVKLRIAATADIEEQLETWLIPAVPSEQRHRSSWPAHFAGHGPRIEIRGVTDGEDGVRRNVIAT